MAAPLLATGIQQFAVGSSIALVGLFTRISLEKSLPGKGTYSYAKDLKVWSSTLLGFAGATAAIDLPSWIVATSTAIVVLLMYNSLGSDLQLADTRLSC